MKNKLLVGIFAALCATAVLAKPASSEQKKPVSRSYRRIITNWFIPQYWEGSANLGFVQNTGNTRNTNFNGKLLLKYNRNRWTHLLDLEGQMTNTQGQRTAQKYFSSLESNYEFARKEFSFVRLSYTRDKFSPYTYTTVGSFGYGKRLLESDVMKLDLQAGPGFRTLKEAGSDKLDNHLILYTQLNYTWKLTKASSFTESLTSELGRPNNNFVSKTALNTKVIGNLGMQLAYNATYNSHIPPRSNNTEHLDTTTTVSLVYSF